MRQGRRSQGLLLGEASLETKQTRSPRRDSRISGSSSEGNNSSSSSSSSSSSAGSGGDGNGGSNGGGGGMSDNDGTRSVYLSGFRIVQEADKSRHAEYAVVVSGRYRHWTRFSQIKAVFNALSGPSMPETSRDAWNAVRSCKSPRGRALDTAHLGRKCLAIETFLSSLLENMPPAYLGQLLLMAAPRSTCETTSSMGNSRVSRKQQQWVPGAPAHISRGRAGLRISTR